ncbi:MAG: DUF3782 domain-containing protein [Candidatus Kapabacteria bacterium]|nr:DUF3782 domain-containing protein [Candidatus Kapabacteria bacterium]
MREKTLTYEQLITIFEKDRLEFQEIRNSIKDLAIESQKTEMQIKEVSKQIEEHGRQIGGLHNNFGKFTEDLFYNSLEKIMFEKFGIQSFDPNRNRNLIGRGTIEIDAIGIVNGSINSVFLTEIKSRFSSKAIDQLKEIMNRFDTFYPEYRDKKKFGVIAIPQLSESQTKEILKAGFYPATLKNDLVVIETPKNFKPKAY